MSDKEQVRNKFANLLQRWWCFVAQWKEADRACESSIALLCGISERLSVLLPPGKPEDYDYFQDNEACALEALKPFKNLSKLLIRSHFKSFDRVLQKVLQQM
jgi:hypothetical protein